MKQFKKFIWNIVTILSCIGLIALLVSAFSDRVSPLNYPYIPFFGLFFPFILAYNAAFFVLWILFRKWTQVVLSLVVFVACIGPVRHYFPIHSRTKEVPENCIKVLTYNVMRFNHLKKHTRNNPNPIIQYVINQNPDIVCFQEHGTVLKDKKHLTEKDLIEALKMPYHEMIRIEHSPSDHFYGISVFSKFPILSVEKFPIESSYNGAALFELDINGKKVSLINVHLESNKITSDERSGYYKFTMEPNTQKLEAFTHMMFQRLTPAYKIRAKQAELINAEIKKSKNPYTIVCGDFNDTPISYARYKINENLSDAFSDTGSGMGITFNQHRFLFRIDYIFHSKNIKAYNCTVGKLRDSDHYPVWTYLELSDN
ncbi:MAG: endonuclease/exonuclease/phosphatase family protein [Dysgonamonadaceae bacterium]|jgi:endonuclease/exonuclease/phosphatase family metal-dependent hydrolase|nr:endonuclease/exonuclease/phosphatase family protein [Dysgonamonadaceae bacterium]